MTDEQSDRFQLSRRKLLGSAAAVGAGGAFGGAATNALFHDEEVFGSAANPNVLEGGTLNLKVDWEAQYYRDGVPLGDGEFVDETSEDEEGANEDGEVEQPGPLVQLADVKPGDVLELTLSSHVYGNPAFLGMHYEELSDEEGNVDDAGTSTSEPERDAHDQHADDGMLDDEGGELDDYVQVVVWHDDDDNAPGEVWEAADDGDGGLVIDEIQNTGDAEAAAADAEHSLEDNDQLIYAGSLEDVPDEGMLDSGNAVSGEPAGTFPGTGCYQNSITEYVGVLAWLPRDIPNVNNNVVQGDRVDFQFGFHAEQCRHNEIDDGNGCEDCSFDSGGASTSPEVETLSTDASGFPDISTFLRIDSDAGTNGDLTEDDFTVCEDGCEQDESVTFTEGSMADIVVVFDDTGSMGDEISELQDAVVDFTNNIETEGIDARYALVSFKDDVDLDQDFTTDSSTFIDAVNGLSASGGGDWPEDDWDGLAVATRDKTADNPSGASLSPYRSGAQRIIIDITDAIANEDVTDLTGSDVEAMLDGFTYIALSPTEDDMFGSPPGDNRDKRILADNVDGTWIDINSAEDLGDLVDDIEELLTTTWTVSYTTTNSDTDGTSRSIVIEITDPDEGTLYATTSYTAPS